MASTVETEPKRALEKKEVVYPHSFMMPQKPQVSSSFCELTDELQSSSSFAKLAERDVDAIFSRSDWLKYRLDLFVTDNPDSRFVFLIVCTLAMMIFLALLWRTLNHQETLESTYSNFQDAFFMTFLVTTTGDINTEVEKPGERLVFTLTVLTGIIVIAVLIGIVTDTMSSAMSSLAEGRSKVIEENHTLILGWNDSTPGLVCQIAFLRRVFRIQNETWTRRLFPWLRVLPSSPVAKHPVVILANSIKKEEMERLLLKAFSEGKVRSKRTKIGRDVIIREGDPTTTHDLLRVSAQNATSVAIMMTENDEMESSLSNGRISNSATIRTVLALRNVMYSNGDPVETFESDCRIIVQLQRPCQSLSAASFLAPSGMEVMYPLDLHDFINTLLFKCVSKPGLSRVITSLLDFEKEAIRCRQASQLKAGKKHTLGYFIGKTVREAMLSHHWSNGVVIGVDEKRESKIGQSIDDTHGITNNPSRIIGPDDWVIFVSPTSSPNHARNIGSRKMTEQAEMILGKEEGSPKCRARRLSGTDFGSNNLTPQHVLLCGWRPEWHTSPHSFRERIRSICDDLTPGSTITCLNVTSTADFHKLMVLEDGSEKDEDQNTDRPAGYAADSAWPVDMEKSELGDHSAGWHITQETGDRTFVVYHAWGDPVNYTCMSWLFHDVNKPPFDSAIVLGNVVGGNIPGEARDSRALSMLLILRELSSSCLIGSKKYEGRYGMHVVVENCVDQTALLAVCPKRTLLKNSSSNNDDVSIASTVKTKRGSVNKAAEMNALRKSINNDKEMIAVIENWAPKPIVIEQKDLEVEVQRISECLGNPVEAVAKLKERISKNAKVLPAESAFSVSEVRIVRTAEDGGDSVASAIFYKLSDGTGWVHDYSPNHIGRRTIRVQLESSEGQSLVPEPDFVNNKAIVARTIAMTLAYPQIQASVMELVSTQAGTPEIELFSPEVLGVPINEEWIGGDRKLQFGVLQNLLDHLYIGYAVAIGYILASDGILVLSPDPGSNISWHRNDRIVTIMRHAAPLSSNDSHIHDDHRSSLFSTPSSISSSNLTSASSNLKLKTVVNSLRSFDGSHATSHRTSKQSYHEDVSTASVVRMTMQPTASLEAIMDLQKRAETVCERKT
mmetsp:Transcript_16355/g.19346  ORF Transcript_16355/g.19346 Transcript_16355/m.19346 type:complete len:1124 (+) Transcript_16355:43-3414(+)